MAGTLGAGNTNAYGQILRPALSAADVTAIAKAVGFSGASLQTIVAICKAESGFIPNATNVNSDAYRSIDRGLSQINNHWHPDVTDAQAFDPTGNLTAAWKISQFGTNFSPWATFTSGAYKQYLGLASGVTGPSVKDVLTKFYDPSKVAQGYGYTSFEPNGHSGVDYMEPLGSDIPALVDGTVVDIVAGCPVVTGINAGSANRCGGGFGNHPVIQMADGSGRTIIYGHMQSIAVTKGQTVRAGQTIGKVGMTGYTTGPHVHFEIDKAGTSGGGITQSQDPTQFIAAALQNAPTTEMPGTVSSATPGGSGSFTLSDLAVSELSARFHQNMTHINGFDGLALTIKRAEAFAPFRFSNPIGSIIVNGRAGIFRFFIIAVGLFIFLAGLQLVVQGGVMDVVKGFGSGAQQKMSGVASLGAEAEEAAALLPTEALAL